MNQNKHAARFGRESPGHEDTCSSQYVLKHMNAASRLSRRQWKKITVHVHAPPYHLLLWLILLVGIAWIEAPPLQGALPVVSNVLASQRSGTKLVDIYYDLADADGNASTIYIYVSADGGTTWNVPAHTFTGDWAGVLPGQNKHLVWDAGEDWNGQFTTRCRVRVIAFDLDQDSMVLIPSGSFEMGTTFIDSGPSYTELPVHSVYVSAFYIQRTEVSKRLWDLVYGWAIHNGYYFENAGLAKGADHPVHTINWYDAVKWCNARSEFENRTPVYYTGADKITVYRAGRLDLESDFVKWTGDGYRLPTEAEWEKAARGGLFAKRFPWGNTITHNQANYYSGGNIFNISVTSGYHPSYAISPEPYTSPVGSFAPNDYGLFDIAGNLSEWCWDWYSDVWYRQVEATATDTRGPPQRADPSRAQRVCRDGDWGYYSLGVRGARRSWNYAEQATNNKGFRCIRSK